MAIQETIPRQTVLQKLTTSLDLQGRFAKQHVEKEKKLKHQKFRFDGEDGHKEVDDHGSKAHKKDKSKLSKKRKLMEDEDAKIESVTTDQVHKKKHKKCKKEKIAGEDLEVEIESKIEPAIKQTVPLQGTVVHAISPMSRSVLKKEAKRQKKLQHQEPTFSDYISRKKTVPEENLTTVAENVNGLTESQDATLPTTLNELQDITQLDPETIKSLDTSHIPESMRERLLRTVKSMSGLRSVAADDNDDKGEHKKLKKKKKQLLPTIETSEFVVDNNTDEIPNGTLAQQNKYEGVGEPVWVKKKYNSPAVLLFNSGVETKINRSTAPSPEVSPAANALPEKNKNLDENRHLDNAAVGQILPPRTDSLAISLGLEKPDVETTQEKKKKSKAILPSTRGLKHGPASSPTPILPAVRTYTTSASKPVIMQDTTILPSKKRPLSASEAPNSTESVRTTSSKRRRKISFQGSPISTDERKVMLTDQEEWEVTTGKFRGSVNLSADRDEDAEITENIAYSSSYVRDQIDSSQH